MPCGAIPSCRTDIASCSYNKAVPVGPPLTTDFICPQCQKLKTTNGPRSIKVASMADASTPAVELPTAGQDAIQSIHDAGLGEIIRLHGSNLYEARNNSYWSRSPRLRPWVIVQPRSTEEVSMVVKALVAVKDCQFAIRSGGHMCWPGASNITSGITVDLGEMDKTTYNAGTKIASIQPGGRWTDVYATLDKDGVMVAGGREGLVGVGGLLLGGGISYYTCRVGFACDQVINYQVVLADGRIVEASQETHQDLFYALKGGGNNFGIVTRFDMVTFPTHDVWDGTIVHSIDETDSIIDALVSLTDNLDVSDNPDAHFLGIWTHSPQMPDVFATSVLTHLDGVPNPESMAKFMKIPGQSSMRKVSLATKVADFLVPSNKYDMWLSYTFKNDARVAKKCVDVLIDLVDHIKTHHVPDGDFVTYSVLQPFPLSFARHSKARGDNMLGLDRIQDNAIVLVTDVQVETLELSQAIAPKMKVGMAEIETYAESLGAGIKFRYSNYCDGSQDPFTSYGEESLRHMREVSQKYDPHGVFQFRVPGGFKIGNV
ncbi:hypothetical protein FJTKL_02711 [Diaporthe vaccinii]|uniref:FAD-binding PCMH-type domain-containing protein n=1 Tax=Diaporthe vaccinii TaxID=105482 RepID=A0ABR4DWR7_9PEZI